MDIFELLAIMCGMMLGILAIIIIIGLVLMEECCIGDGMDIFELLAIMCGMMLGIVAIIIIIGLVMGSIK